MMMKAALYERVSSDEQSLEGFSIRAQEERLVSYAKSQGWTIHKIYKDEAYSAKTLNRPAMNQLIQDVKRGHVDVILVYKLDRLVRSISDLHDLLLLFDEHKVSFKSATEIFDTTTATGRMFISLVALFAQWELEQLRERTIFGMERKFKEGQRNGGSAPYGYELDADNQLVKSKQSETVQWMFDNAILMGKKAIAKELNKKGIKANKGSMWNASMVDYVLNNPVYCGKLRWNYRTKKGTRTYEEIVTKGNHEPIISEEQFEQVQSARKKRKRTGFKGHAHYPFTSVAKCARCGHNFIGGRRKRADGSEYRFYKCNGRFVYGVCDVPVIGEKVLEDELMKKMDFIKLPTDVPETELDNKDQLEKQLKRIDDRLERLKELYIEGDIPKEEYRERLNEEKEKESEIIQTLDNTEKVVTQQELDMIIQSLKSEWSHISLIKRKEAIHTLFESLTIHVLSSHKGGRGNKVVVEITDYSLN